LSEHHFYIIKAPTTPTKAKTNPLTTVFSAPELDPELFPLPEEEVVVVGAAVVVVLAELPGVVVDEELGVAESRGAGGTLAVPVTRVTVSAAMTEEA